MSFLSKIFGCKKTVESAPGPAPAAPLAPSLPVESLPAPVPSWFVCRSCGYASADIDEMAVGEYKSVMVVLCTDCLEADPTARATFSPAACV